MVSGFGTPIIILVTYGDFIEVAQEFVFTAETCDVHKANLLLKSSFTGATKPAIRNGEFSAVFGGKTNTLSTGEYELTISSPINSLQPQQIQTLLGQDGANLFGVGVIEDRSGKRISLEDRIYLP